MAGESDNDKTRGGNEMRCPKKDTGKASRSPENKNERIRPAEGNELSSSEIPETEDISVVSCDSLGCFAGGTETDFMNGLPDFDDYSDLLSSDFWSNLDDHK